MNKQQFFANIALLLTGLIWGLSFVAQRAGMEYIGPFTFNAIRCFLGCLSLLPVIWIFKFIHPDTRTKELKHKQHIDLFKGGLCCGFMLFLAMSIQQYCMKFVPAGKAGFISALYLIFVPIFYAFWGKKLGKNVIISLFVAILGLYFLCFKADASFNIYDGILLVSAIFYALHILVVDYFSPKTNPAKLSCIQFLFVGIFSLILMLGFEAHVSFSSILACKVPLFYAGVLTCGIAYTLQIFGQKYTPPVVASLILSLESVFAVIGGMLLLSETLTLREFLGCFLMISAVIISKIKLSRKVAR